MRIPGRIPIIWIDVFGEIFLCLCLNNRRDFMTGEYELGKDELLL